MGKNQTNEKIRQEILGKTFYTIFNEKYTVIDYIDYHNVLIEFDNGYKTYAHKNNVEKGNVKNRYRKGKYGQYIGEGKYDTKNKDKKCYSLWLNMFIRCYDEKELKKHPKYKDCYVCEEWFNFSNFAKWFYKNNWMDLSQSSIIDLDKDILIKNNKVYSPSTCLIVPHRINTLFIKTDSTRNGLIGTYLNQNGKYTAQCNIGSKTNRNLGSFNTEKEAFYAYKKAKENYIKKVADEYKEKYKNFPTKIYNAMYKYEVNITD